MHKSCIQTNGMNRIRTYETLQPIASKSPETHTQVVVNKICSEGGLFVFTASIHACAGIRRVHGEDVCADTHELGFPHQLSYG